MHLDCACSCCDVDPTAAECDYMCGITPGLPRVSTVMAALLLKLTDTPKAIDPGCPCTDSCHVLAWLMQGAVSEDWREAKPDRHRDRQLQPVRANPQLVCAHPALLQDAE